MKGPHQPSQAIEMVERASTLGVMLSSSQRILMYLNKHKKQAIEF